MNPGVSGGPVLNPAGDVVGVAAAGIRNAGGLTIEGVNLAIPAERVQEVLSRVGG
ncbi:MAG: serine protease [Chloroflexi bacterium]|nr:serine protease [Chloroflexota bacterium]